MLPYRLIPFLAFLATPLSGALYNFGSEPGSQILKPDGESALTLQVPIIYMENQIRVLYIYPNGVVSFDGDISPEANLFEEHQDAIAVFQLPTTDVTLHYRDTKDDRSLLQNLSTLVREAYPDASKFTAHYAVIITWEGQTNAAVGADKNNRFQLVLITDQMSSYALLIYDRIEMPRVDNYAVTSFFSSDGRRNEVVSSATELVAELPKISNIGRNGQFLFRISSRNFEEPRMFGQSEDSDEGEDLDEDKPDSENGSMENEGCPLDPYLENCPENCEVITDDRDCSKCICGFPAPPQPVEPADEKPEEVTKEETEYVYVNPVTYVPHVPETEATEAPESQPNEVPPYPLPEETPEEPVDTEPAHYPYPSFVPDVENPLFITTTSRPSPPPVRQPQAPKIGEGAVYPGSRYSGAPFPTPIHPTYPDIISQLPKGIPLSCAAANEKKAACDAHAHCIDYNPGYCCECGTGYYGNGEQCLKKGESQRMHGEVDGLINGVEIKGKKLHTFADTKEGQAYFALNEMPEYVGNSLLLVDEIGTVIGWLFAKLDSPGAYNGFELTGGIFNRTVSIRVGDRYAVLLRQQFTGRDEHNYFKVQMHLTGTLPRVDERAHVIYPPRDVEYRREGPGVVRSFSAYTILVKEQGFEHRIRVMVDQQIYYKECSFKRFDKEPVVVVKVSRPHAVYDVEEKNVRYAAENKAINGFVEPGHPSQKRPGDLYREKFRPVTQPPYRPQEQQQPGQPQQPQEPVTQYPQVAEPCAPGRHQCMYPHMSCFVRDGKGICKCDDGFTGVPNATVTSLGWYCKDIDECQQFPHKCHANADCYNTEGGYECVCKPGFTGDGRINCQRSGAGKRCEKNEDCHRFAECVPTSNGESECRCRGWYVGDGVTVCGPPATPAPIPTTVPHRPDSQHCGYYRCHKDADCIVSPDETAGVNRMTCRCREGFFGNGVSCELRVPVPGSRQPGKQCTSNQSCVQHASCVRERDGIYRCVCVPPRVPENGACINKAEIAKPTSRYVGCNVVNNCHRNAECKRIGDTYHCICRPGYVGSGFNCQLHVTTPAPSLQCDRLQNCGIHAACAYETATKRYVCRCLGGYTGDGFTCTPIGQLLPTRPSPTLVFTSTVASAGHVCTDRSECHPNAHCVYDSEARTHFCECLNGYEGDGVNECRRLDECNPAKAGGCSINERCEYDNEVRAFKCKCVDGYKSDGTCQEPTPPGCNTNPALCQENAQCVFSSEEQRYTCVCKDGWVGDGFTSCQMTQSQKCALCSAKARCVVKADGDYACVCLPGFQGNGQVCAPYTSCLNDRTICDANAECVLNAQNMYVCNCNYGYHGNGRTCTVDTDSRDMLLIARGMSIIERGMSPDTLGKQLIVKHQQLIVGLGYDCQEHRIVWSDIKGTINTAYLNGTGAKLLFRLNSPEGIAVDWSSRNFYYVDSKLRNPEIGVASLDGKYRKTLAREGFNQPRYLALDMTNRHLYYSDWHRAHPIIGRMNLDGTDNFPFVDGNLSLPNGLVVLEKRKELCWLDAGLQHLVCMDLGPSRVRRIVYAPLEYPFGLTVHEEKQFFWTDWHDSRLHTVSVNGYGYTSYPITVGSSGKPYGIIAIPSSCRQVSTPCSFENGGCRYLCVPGQEDARCICPDEPKGLEGC